MEGKVLEKEAFTIVGMGWTGPYAAAAAGEVRELWKRFTEREGEIEGKVRPGVFVSPCHDRETDFTCYIGAEVEEVRSVPKGCLRGSRPALRGVHPARADEQGGRNLPEGLGLDGEEGIGERPGGIRSGDLRLPLPSSGG